MSQPQIIDTDTAWLLAEPALRAYSDLPGLTNDQKNQRAAHGWAVIISFGPLNAYGVMLVAHSLPLNEMLADAAHDAIVESKYGMLGGQESRMKQRCCASYVGLNRALTQNMMALMRLTKETAPAAPRATAAMQRAAAKADAAPPDAVSPGPVSPRQANPGRATPGPATPGPANPEQANPAAAEGTAAPVVGETDRPRER